MQSTSPPALLRCALILFFVMLPACAKKETHPTSVIQAAQTIDTREQARAEQEQLQAQKLKKEADEQALRAATIKFMYEDIYFKKGSYALTPEAVETLIRKAEWLRNQPTVNVIIEGHTDEGGSKEYNFALGDRRAGEVKSFLIRQGVASERLIAVSYGEENPIDSDDTEMAREKNRRVHFVIE